MIGIVQAFKLSKCFLKLLTRLMIPASASPISTISVGDSLLFFKHGILSFHSVLAVFDFQRSPLHLVCIDPEKRGIP